MVTIVIQVKSYDDKINFKFVLPDTHSKRIPGVICLPL